MVYQHVLKPYFPFWKDGFKVRACHFIALERVIEVFERIFAIVPNAYAALIQKRNHSFGDFQAKVKMPLCKFLWLKRLNASLTMNEPLNLRFIMRRQRFVKGPKRMAGRHQALRHGQCLILHVTDQPQADFLLTPQRLKDDGSYGGFRHIKGEFPGDELYRLITAEHQLQNGLAAVCAGAFIAVLQTNAAGIQAAHIAQSSLTKLSMQSAPAVIHTHGTVSIISR